MLPTVSVVVFLLAGAVLSRVEWRMVAPGRPGLPGTAEAATALRLLGADPPEAWAERPV